MQLEREPTTFIDTKSAKAKDGFFWRFTIWGLQKCFAGMPQLLFYVPMTQFKMAAVRFRGKSKFLNIPSKIICNTSISDEF